jgi:hypothetical protein
MRLTEADAGTRTPDPHFTRVVLYQLSYVGAGKVEPAAPRIVARERGGGGPRTYARSSRPKRDRRAPPHPAAELPDPALALARSAGWHLRMAYRLHRRGPPHRPTAQSAVPRQAGGWSARTADYPWYEQPFGPSVRDQPRRAVRALVRLSWRPENAATTGYPASRGIPS